MLNQMECLGILYSLAMKCPFDLKCDNCPMLNIWQIEIEDRIDYIENLQQEERKNIVNKHFEMFNKNHNHWKF